MGLFRKKVDFLTTKSIILSSCNEFEIILRFFGASFLFVQSYFKHK